MSIPSRRAIEERTCSRIQILTFDFAGLQNVKGQRLKFCFLLQGKAKRLHAPKQASLLVTDGGKWHSKDFLIPMKSWPFRQLVDIAAHSTHLMRRL